MEEQISPDVVAMPYWMSAAVSSLYREAGAVDKSRRYAGRSVAAVEQLGDNWMQDPYARTYHPIQIKAQMLANMGEYDRAIETYEKLRRQYSNDPNVRAQIEELRIERHLEKNDTLAAISEIEQIIGEYGATTDRTERNNVEAYRARLAELKGEAAAPADVTDVADTTARTSTSRSAAKSPAKGAAKSTPARAGRPAATKATSKQKK
jgi:tetratricopeptide (TPR) repeat protein